MTNIFDDKFEHKMIEIMKKIGYEGIYCIEFIIDENDIPYFLEINFRNSGWSYASTCVGMPLPILWINSMITNTIDKSNIKKIPENFTFIEEVEDFKIRAGKLVSYLQWFKEYKNSNCKLIFGKNDIKPFFCYLFYRVISMFKRKLKQN